jgi:hypothetical protein
VDGAENFPFSLFHSHGQKQVKWTCTAQSHNAETEFLVTMDSDSDESHSNTLTAEDERGYEQLGIDSLLKQACVPLKTSYTGCSSAQVPYGASKDNDE